ncbi:MAG: hypothetical protein MZV63_27380 [Marinilabiliales bacterium]|nr:hypothetical protein [Marinilabiliales bacterium]
MLTSSTPPSTTIMRDDFKPYVLKSTDKGKNWISISANLPANGPVHTIEQDHVEPEPAVPGHGIQLLRLI